MTASTLEHLHDDGLVACHECDALHRLHPLHSGERAHCSRCGALLYRDVRGELDHALAYASAAAVLFLLANLFPLIGLRIENRIEENVVVSGIVALWQAGQPELAVLVALTSVAFPALTIFGMLWLLLPLKLGLRAPGTAGVFRVVHAIGPWSLLGVYMLGLLVAFVKLADLATVIPGVSMYAFVGLMLCTAAASAHFDPSLLWPPRGPRLQPPAGVQTAHEAGLVACHVCGLLVSAEAASHTDADGRAHCPRCDSVLHGARKHDSIARTWALVIAAALLTIPANVYPVMTVIRFGQGEPSTILAGVQQLVQEGMYGLAFIVFFASIVVPFLKLGLLCYLLISVQRRSPWRPRDRTRLYRITEVVGAWSMVDIFLVGILSGLVQLEALATIEPGIGASYFGGVVVVTMFAAQSFDSRLIWDHAVRDS